MDKHVHDGTALLKTRDEDPTFFSTDPDPAQLEIFRIRPEIEMKKKIYLYILGT